MSQFSRFSFTIFDKNIDYYDKVFEELTPPLTYICAQKEVCPSTGKVHFQGYFETKTKRRLSAMIKYFHQVWPTAHLEVSRGSAQQNRDYCSKSDSAVPESFYEEGKPMAQGKRADIADVLQRLKAGETVCDILEDHPHLFDKVKYLEQYRSKYVGTDLRDLTVFYLWGPAGAGKTKYVWDYCKKNNLQAHFATFTSQGDIWHDGYDDQQVEVLDDIDIRKLNRTYLLRILDRYPVRLNCKGTTVPAQYTTVFITSNFSPPEDPAIVRRLTHVIHLNGDEIEHF